MSLEPFILIIKNLKPIVLILEGIKVNNIVQVFEGSFIRLKWYTERTSLAKLNKETGEPHPARLLAHLAEPRWRGRDERVGAPFAVNKGNNPQNIPKWDKFSSGRRWRRGRRARWGEHR
jgi:hypothetical protein